jgi:hypothetical protein
MTTAQIFDKYASPEQQGMAEELHKRFWTSYSARKMSDLIYSVLMNLFTEL